MTETQWQDTPADMTAINAAFKLFRAWLLQPDFSLADPTAEMGNLYGLTKKDRGLLSKIIQQHNWAAEPELTDLIEYSGNRADRVLNQPTRFPTMVYQLVLRQMFDAADHGIETPLTTAPQKIDRLFEKNARLRRRRVERGEYVLRQPAGLAKLRMDIERVMNLGGGWLSDSFKNDRKLLATAEAVREQLFRRHLAALLSESEYGDVKDMGFDIQCALYPHIWENGQELYASHLRATCPIDFKYHTSPVAQTTP